MHDLATLAHRPELITQTLRLRRPGEEDLAAIVAIVGDRDVARRLARVPHPYGEAEARFFLETVVPSEWVWAVTLRGATELVGAVGLTPDAHGDSADLGYWLSRRHWGRGVMPEAARAVVSHGFGRLGLSRITSAYFEDNPASGRVLEKLGFVETGRAMRTCLATASEVRSVEMELLRQAEA